MKQLEFVPDEPAPKKTTTFALNGLHAEIWHAIREDEEAWPIYSEAWPGTTTAFLESEFNRGLKGTLNKMWNKGLVSRYGSLQGGYLWKRILPPALDGPWAPRNP